MRVKYKGYLLAADRSFENPGTISAIFKIPELESIFEFHFDCSPSEAIKLLKEKINERRSKE